MPGYATRRSGPFFPTSWPWGHGSPIDLGVMSKGRIHCRAGLWYSHSFDNRGGFDNHWERVSEGAAPGVWYSVFGDVPFSQSLGQLGVQGLAVVFTFVVVFTISMVTFKETSIAGV